MTYKTSTKIIILLILFLFFILTPFYEYRVSRMKDRNNDYLLFERNGTISLLDHNYKTKWKTSLNHKLIETKINVQYVNFEESNVLPGENGVLYLIDSKEEKYKMLNYSIPELVRQSPIVIESLSKDIFYGKSKSNFFEIDLSNGEIRPFHVDRFVTEKNDGIVLVKQIDYLLQLLNQEANIVIWEAYLCEINVKGENKEINNALVNEFKDVAYLFKYDTNSKIVTKIVSDKASFNERATFFDFVLNHILTIGKYLLLDLFIVSLHYIWNYIQYSEEHKTQIESQMKEKKSDINVPSENNSRLSTKTITNKSEENKHFNNSFSYHREVNYTKILTIQKAKQEVVSHPTIKKRDSIENQNQISITSLNFCSLSPRSNTSQTSFLPKKKYTPTPELLQELNVLSNEYLKEANNPSSETTVKIENNASVSKKYTNLYKLVSPDTSDNDSCADTSLFKSQLFNLNQKNAYLIDTGRFISNFDTIELVGKGGFGCVFRAMHKIDGSYYAIKIIKFNVSSEDNLSKIKEVQEIKTMMKVEHKNIVRYITCWFELEDQEMVNRRGRALSMDEKMMSSTKKQNDIVFGGNDSEGVSITNDKEDKKRLIKSEIEEDLHKDTSEEYNDDDYDYGLDIEEENEIQFCSFDNSCLIFEEEKEGKKNKEDSFTDSADIKINLHSKKEKKITFPVFFFMQMEYCEGCPLSFYLQNRNEKSPRGLITNIFSQIVKAVKHIHSKNIIHRDLKPANIFIRGDFKIKIGDFGLAEETNEIDKLKDQVGTYLYQSPEQLEGKEYNEKVDIFALGLILMEMCCLCKTESERRVIILNVRKGVYPEELEEYPQEKELIQKMTLIDPNKRYSINDVINSDEMWLMLENM